MYSSDPRPEEIRSSPISDTQQPKHIRTGLEMSNHIIAEYDEFQQIEILSFIHGRIYESYENKIKCKEQELSKLKDLIQRLEDCK